MAIMDVDMDTESGIVKWVASQSTNPALQALMKEAERERKTRPSTPVHEPASWSYPLTATSSSTSLSASVASPWQSTSHNAVDATYPLPLSGSSSSSSLALPTSDPSASRRAKPLSAAQRKPLAASTSSTNQPLRDYRPRSSSHSTTLSHSSASKTKYIPQEEEPEAVAFLELLKDVSKQLDQNSEKKQRLAARTKDKERDRSLGRSSIDSRTGLQANKLSARSLTKTSSASAICPVGLSTKPLEATYGASTSSFKPEPRGRVLGRTESLRLPGVDLEFGMSTPASLPRVNLSYDLKLAPTRTFDIPNTRLIASHKTNTLELSSNDGNSTMQDVTGLTEIDMEWEKPIPGPMSRINTATYMQVDDDDAYEDAAMDMSFFPAESLPSSRVAAPKPKPHTPQPNAASRLPVPTQRTRTGPPPLGMRRVPQPLQPSQYGPQVSKGVTLPRFKPPLFVNAGRTSNKNGSGKKLATTTSSTLPPREGNARAAVAESVARRSQDADSSFDMSFGVDADALEEAMKAYD